MAPIAPTRASISPDEGKKIDGTPPIKVDASEFIGNTRSPLDLVYHIEDFDKQVELRDGDKLIKAPTIRGLREAIPDVCRVRSIEISFMFLIRDLIFLGVNAALAHKLIPLFCGENVFLRAFAWVCFALTQGTLATGVWVVGHECGHKAFSPNDTLNDIVGYILHTALLVPYFSWQFSHAKHHKYTNHMHLGETHVPPLEATSARNKKIWGVLGDDGFAWYELFLHLVLGWPVYLMTNATGGTEAYNETKLVPSSKGGGPVDHFRATNSQLFPPSVRNKVRLSAYGIILVIGMVIFWGMKYGWSWPICHYLGPYVVANGWLVLYTWLHHGDRNVPHYDKETFTWFRGALSTVDRNYPWIIDELHHHIGTTHVVHHLEAKIPHYNAVQATKYATNYLGPFYRQDPKSLLGAVWHAGKYCHFVKADKGVQFMHPIREVAMQ